MARDGDEQVSNTAVLTVTVKAPVVARLVVTASATTVDQGGSVTLSATGFTADNAELGDVTDQVTFTSDVATDVVAGNRVAFPHASPHTLTGTHTSGVSSTVVVAVTPASTDPAPAPAPDTGTGAGAAGFGHAARGGWPLVHRDLNRWTAAAQRSRCPVVRSAQVRSSTMRPMTARMTWWAEQ